MKKATAKTTAKATAKTTVKATAKSSSKKAPAKKPVAKKTPAKRETTVRESTPMAVNTVFITNDKWNKLERALAEKQISYDEYEMWKVIYAKEVPFNKYAVEDDYRPRKTKRRRAY